MLEHYFAPEILKTYECKVCAKYVGSLQFAFSQVMLSIVWIHFLFLLLTLI